ncbi:MAG: Ig-like domain-containing protein, partial [bacterium]|nr:Ig-like domain-containing protein [bacterium]
APMDGMMGAPTKINIPATGNMEAPINIGFSKAMDSTTITSSNIKIYPVTAAGLGTALAGVSVAYQSAGGQATLTDRGNRQVSFGPNDVAVVYSATALSANSQYVIDLSSSVKDAAGNILQGNKSGGGHSISFTTSGDFSTFTPGQMTTGFNTFMAGGGGGQYTPPYVTGSTPTNGAKNVPTNTKIVVNFSQPMDSAGINTTSGVGTYVKLYDTSVGGGAGQYVTVDSITLDVNTKQSATIVVGGAGLTASHSNYAIRVLGGAKSATGMTMAMPGQESNVMYQADFSTGSGSDTGAPAVIGSTLQSYTAVTPCTGANVCVSGVPTNIGVIELSFSKDMDSSTINSSNITLKSGTTDVSSTVSYDSMSRSAKVTPNTVLYTVTTYTLTVGVGVKAMNGTVLAANYIISFTTNSTVDAAGPNVSMANADDYKLAITFSEPMNAAKATDTTNWAASVLNPTNYVLYTNNSPPPFTLNSNVKKYFTNDTLATATDAASGGPVTLKYDAAYSTVFIEGLKLMDS